jgi:hypothetical protein
MSEAIGVNVRDAKFHMVFPSDSLYLLYICLERLSILEQKIHEETCPGKIDLKGKK